MKTQSFYAKRIQPIVFMAVVTIICIILTAALHLYTYDQVKENEQFFVWRSVLDSAAISHDGTPSDVVKLFDQYVTEDGDMYVVNTPEHGRRFVLEQTGPGLWGPITVMIGFEDDKTTLSGVSIVSQTETPGLGARIEEPWFTAQFAGKKGPSFKIVEEGTASQPKEIDSITGATRTSDAFKSIIEKAFVLAGGL